MTLAATDSPVVIITGASTGIGMAISQRLVGSHFRSVLTAKHSSLNRFENAGIADKDNLIVRALDVRDSDQQRQLIDEVLKLWGRIDVLINNAGTSLRAVIEHIDPNDEQEQFDINYFGPMRLTRLVLPVMRNQLSGHIINVSSVGGMMAMPTMGAYSASKFALEGASEALWYETRPWGIRVTLVEPGFIHSNAFRKISFTTKSQEAINNPSSPYYSYYRYMGNFIEKMMNKAFATPDAIALKILTVMRKKSSPLRLPVTIDAWLFYFLRRMLPRKFYHYVLFQSLPKIKLWVKK